MKLFNKGKGLALAIGLSLGVSVLTPVLPTTQVEAGMNPVKLDPFLTKAASNHWNYLWNNSTAEGHNETRGNKGFTWVSPKDRVRAVGGSVGDYLGESIVFRTNIHTDGITHLVHEAPLHREDLLNPDLQSVGIEVEKGNPKGFHVIKVRIDKYGERDSDHVYPVNGMKNVNPLFGGNEIPNPLKNYGIAQSGHILTYWLPSDIYVSDGDLSFVLKDSKGVTVPAFLDFFYSGTARLIPKQQLKWGETYTATVKWKARHTTATGGRTWSFTTMTSDPNVVTPPKPAPVEVIKESKDYTVIKAQPLYASNSTSSKQIVQVPANAKVRSIEKRASWMKVTYNGSTGWVAVNNLKAYVAPKTVTMYTNKATKAYTTRSTKGKVAFNLANGAKVTRTGVNGSWSQVKVGTKTGWVASRDLSTSAPVATKAVDMTTNKKATVYTTRSTKGKVAFTVPANAKVSRLAVNGSWSEISYNGKKGWVASRDLSAVSQVNTIKTQYGSHTYGVDSQAEYDAVMKLVRDEFNKSFNSKEFDVHPDIYRVLNGERGTTNRSDPKFLSPENAGLLDAEIAARPLLEGRISLDTYKQIYRANSFFSHLMRVSGTKDVVGNKNVKSAHDALIKKTTDCDATAHVQSIVYDMAGIDNAVIGDGVTHAMIVLKVKEGWMGSGANPFTKEQINQVNRDNIYLSYTQSGAKIQ